MGKRRAGRELALKFLYQTEFNSENSRLELDSFFEDLSTIDDLEGDDDDNSKTDNTEESSPAHGDSPTEYEKMEELFKSISSGSVIENGCGRLSQPFESFKVA